jgi:hypothetical protein
MSKMFGGLAALDTVSTAATAIAAESDLLLLHMAHMLLLCSAAPSILYDRDIVRRSPPRPAAAAAHSGRQVQCEM